MSISAQQPRSLLSLPPTRCWYATGKRHPDGSPLWASREWNPGEQKEYLQRIRLSAQQLAGGTNAG